jgi:hypothetical protein
MTHSDSSPININLLKRNPNAINRENSLRRERLIDLIEIYIILVQARLCEDGWDGIRWTYTHDSRGYANYGRSDIFSDDGEAEAFGC